MLNELLSKLQKEGNQKLITMLKYISPVAWININLYGHYTFDQDESIVPDMAKLADEIDMLKTI